MRKLCSLVLVTLLAGPLAGCLIRSDRPHHNNSNANARRGGNSCGPAYHWDGYKCVHNGNGRARGHRK
ncbi:MAG TPA: hypothetical protein VK427_01955 [Kofleriaceae bacterium]|nr:hypothetical protein [Kofleriaceae bacterium]